MAFPSLSWFKFNHFGISVPSSLIINLSSLGSGKSKQLFGKILKISPICMQFVNSTKIELGKKVTKNCFFIITLKKRDKPDSIICLMIVDSMNSDLLHPQILHMMEALEFLEAACNVLYIGTLMY